jgi:hypothetical protein
MAGNVDSPNLIGAPLEPKILEQIRQRSMVLNQTGTRNADNLLAIANKNCWVRLSSFVDIGADGVTEINKSIGEFKVQGGASLAEAWALKAEQRSGKMRYGVENLTGAYGSGGKNEVGYRPMPGIQSVSIESQPPLGAIRSAVVKIKAWNLNQLSIIDIIYFRLGYTMLLEWGHSVFTDNNSNLVVNPIPIDVFSKQGLALTKEDVLKQLARKREQYSYNYDGSLGVVTNYSWTQNGDGSYDCTLNLTGLGSVIESLKMNTQDAMPDVTAPSAASTPQVTTPDDSSLLGFLTALENQPTGQLDYNALFSKGANLLNKPTEDFLYGYNTGVMSLPTGATIPTTLPKVNFTNLETRLSLALIELSGTQASAPKKQTYLKLGMLLAYINNSCLLYEKNKPFVPVDFNPDTNFSLRMPHQFSIDPEVCLVDTDCSDTDYSDLLTIKTKSNTPATTPTSPATSAISKAITTGTGGYIDTTAGKGGRGKFMNIYVNTTCIRNTVMECTDKEKNVFMSNFLSTLMGKIQVALGNINNFKIGFDETANTCYIYDAQLVDQQNQKAAIPTLPVFGLQSVVRDFNLKTEASTKIGSMLAITARAGAVNTGQNSDSAAFTILNRSLTDRLLPSLSTVTEAAKTAAFNQQQAIQNKFVTGLAANAQPNATQLLTGQNFTAPSTPPATPTGNTSTTDGNEALALNFNAQVRNLYGLDTTGIVIRYDRQALDSIKNYYIDAILRLKGTLNPNTGTGDSVAATGVLPLALNMTMDGIGGIPLYQAFTLPANRLPVQYTKDGQPRIAFTIAGLNHTIENNQWTTAIRGLMINIPEGSRVYTPNYKSKQNTASTVPTPAITGGTVSGDYIPYAKLKPTTQQAVNQGLVLVREASTQQRTVGTMWYKGQVLGFVVEDAIRTTKVDNQTAVPAGKYAITLDTTKKDSLKKYYVRFPGEKGKLASPGVFARVGDAPTAVNINGPGNVDFGGIRIHGGYSENSSSGCLIYSSKRNKNGTVVDDINHNFALTQLIYKDKINGITIINEFA